jgi:hypothetical protein
MEHKKEAKFDFGLYQFRKKGKDIDAPASS